MYRRVNHKRESGRLPAVLQAGWRRPDGDVALLQTGNISVEGMLLRSASVIPPDQQIELEINMPGGEPAVHATVQARFIGAADSGYTIGARIVAMSDSDRARWLALYQRLQPANAEPAASTPEPVGRSNPHLLILASALRPDTLAALTASGSFVSVARDAQEALALLHQRPGFEILICEVRRNDLDGRTLCELIKQDRTLQDVQVLLVAGEQSARDLADGLAAGATYVVARPFTEEFLLSLISLCQRA